MSEHKYHNLLNPIQLPNGIVLKNRVNAAAATNNFIQGTTVPWPSEAMITMIANRAKNGAAMVTLTGVAEKNSVAFYHEGLPSVKGYSGADFFTLFDLSDRRTHPIFSQLTESVHMYKSKIIMQLLTLPPKGYDVSPGVHQRFGLPDEDLKELTPEMLDEIKASQVEWAKYAKQCGFDGVLVHMCYRFSVAARLLSRRTNKRSDAYGGSLENRCKWPLEVCEEIKRACGNQFIVEAVISGRDSAEDGWTIEDSITFAKMAEGKVDLIQVRHAEIDPSHPSSYQKEHYPMLADAAAIKAGGGSIPIETIGGYNNLDDMEDIIASGKADIITSARAWISNPNFGKLIEEGRGEDVVPCIRCNKCHHRSMITANDFMVTNCSVNPVWGLEHRINNMFDKPTVSKKVAVVGGGPAGMKAALVAAQRGHKVTIYEKSGALGGLLNTTDADDFKWTVTRYKNWLIQQIEKNPDIETVFHATVNADLLAKEGYDAVLIAVGSEPAIPKIKGIENAKSCLTVLRNEIEAASDVVIIGGGEVGVETGMRLAKTGHNAFVIEAMPMLAASSNIMHYYSHLVNAWSALPAFKYALNASVTEITKDSVKYTDARGEAKEIKAGTILYAVGMKPKRDEAMKLFNSAAYDAYLIGDCDNPANIQALNRDAYGAASII